MKKIFVIAAVALLTACSSNPEKEKTQAHLQPVVPNPYQQDKYQDQRMYTVAASRTTNLMLEQTDYIYRKTLRPKIYVRPVKKVGSEHLPDGFSTARKVTEDIIAGSDTFILTSNPDDAKYQLDIAVSKLDVAALPGDVIQYKVTLYDRWNNQAGVWIETLRQVQNDDKSWW